MHPRTSETDPTAAVAAVTDTASRAAVSASARRIGAAAALREAAGAVGALAPLSLPVVALCVLAALLWPPTIRAGADLVLTATQAVRAPGDPGLIAALVLLDAPLALGSIAVTHRLVHRRPIGVRSLAASTGWRTLWAATALATVLGQAFLAVLELGGTAWTRSLPAAAVGLPVLALATAFVVLLGRALLTTTALAAALPGPTGPRAVLARTRALLSAAGVHQLFFTSLGWSFVVGVATLVVDLVVSAATTLGRLHGDAAHVTAAVVAALSSATAGWAFTALQTCSLWHAVTDQHVRPVPDED